MVVMPIRAMRLVTLEIIDCVVFFLSYNFSQLPMGSEGWLEKLVQAYSQGGGSVPTKQGNFQIMFGLLQDPYSQFFVPK